MEHFELPSKSLLSSKYKQQLKTPISIIAWMGVYYASYYILRAEGDIPMETDATFQMAQQGNFVFFRVLATCRVLVLKA